MNKSRIASALRARLRLGRRLPPGAEVSPNAEIRGNIAFPTSSGRIRIARDSVIDGTLIAECAESILTVGTNSFVGRNTIVDCALSITIGNDVLVSYNCIITDSDNHSLSRRTRRDDLRKWRAGAFDWSVPQRAPVTICDGAWIGAGAIILKGTTIGEGAIVGAGAVVTRNVPAWTIVAGNPAIQVRALEPEHEK